MDKQSVLYDLMAMRMNDIMNEVAEHDEDYQASLRAVDPYIAQLNALHLPQEIKQLIDDCISGHVAIGSCFGRLAYLQGFYDCRELFLMSAQPEKEVSKNGLV